MGARRQWRHLSALSNNSSPPPPLLLFWLRVNWFALSLLPPHFLLLPPPPLPSIYYYFFLLFFCCFVFKKGAKGGRGGGGGGGGGRGGRGGRGGKKGNNSNNLSETCRLLGADSWAQNRTELRVAGLLRGGATVAPFPPGCGRWDFFKSGKRKPARKGMAAIRPKVSPRSFFRWAFDRESNGIDNHRK